MAGVVGGRRVRAATAVALVVTLALAGLAAWAVHSVVRDQENRLLTERANELNIVLATAVNAIPTGLAAQGGILRATHGSLPAYEQSVREAMAAQPATQKVTYAWVRHSPDGSWVVADAIGSTLHTGQVLTDAYVKTFDQALTTPKMVPTPLIGRQRILGFALGPPAAPAGTVLYRESALGPIKAPQAAASAPFAELYLAIYNGPHPRTAQPLAANTTALPLTGTVRNVPLPVGSQTWTTSVKAKRPLVGGVAHSAWWWTLLGGIVGSLLIAAVVEIAARRRDAALALYASEHQVAETLQRSLLPQLPTLAGLEMAARYVAGGSGQQVGGDWFDAFPVSRDLVGIAVGDVIGHDLEAASAMAQIRAALRAYAIDGERPGVVINRLDRLVDTLGLTQLVTVIYAVLGPPEPDGSRVLTYTNAGHLAPMVRLPSGEVRTLDGVESVVIGAPVHIEHAQVEQRLPPGSTLFLFTDGLVEVPGRPLEDTLRELSDKIAAHDPDAGLESMCEEVLSLTYERELRDDVAMLAVRISPGRPTADAVGAGAPTATAQGRTTP